MSQDYSFDFNSPRPRGYTVPTNQSLVLYDSPRQAANAARTRQTYTAEANPTDWLNSRRGIAVIEGLGYGLGGLMSGGYALNAGASPGQALGIAGSAVAGDAAGSLLGHLAGTAAIPLLGPAAPFAGRMIGGMIGGIAGDRVGWKVTGAEADLNRRYQEQQMQQYQMNGQPMFSPTPEQKMRNEILSSAQNPYIPYMMAQLGGYYA